MKESPRPRPRQLSLSESYSTSILPTKLGEILPRLTCSISILALGGAGRPFVQVGFGGKSALSLCALWAYRRLWWGGVVIEVPG